MEGKDMKRIGGKTVGDKPFPFFPMPSFPKKSAISHKIPIERRVEQIKIT